MKLSILKIVMAALVAAIHFPETAPSMAWPLENGSPGQAR
jgi:hypothetical protein